MPPLIPKTFSERIRAVRIVIFIATLALSLLLSSNVRAQMSVKSLSTRLPATGSADEDCSDFIANPKPIRDDFDARRPQLISCSASLKDTIPDAHAAGGKSKALDEFKQNYGLSSATTDEINEQLIKTHFLIRILRRWSKLNPSADGVADTIANLELADSRLHDLMDYTGLLDPLAGSLVAGPAFSDTGKLSQGTVSSGSG